MSSKKKSPKQKAWAYIDNNQNRVLFISNESEKVYDEDEIVIQCYGFNIDSINHCSYQRPISLEIQKFGYVSGNLI